MADQTPRAKDAFPVTRQTFLGKALRGGEGGRDEANRHIMTLYARPLKVYFLGSTFRDMGDPDEIVDGFFADRLTRDGFLMDWLESGHRLRFWIMHAFRNYVLELIQKDKRWRRAFQTVNDRESRPESEPDPEHLFHREAGISVVRAALAQVERECRARGQDDHWFSFHQHFVEGRDFDTVKISLGVDRARAAVMARTVRAKFRRALWEQVSWATADSGEVEAELHALREVLS